MGMPYKDAPEKANQNASLSGMLSIRGPRTTAHEREIGAAPEVPKKLAILIVEDERIVARDLQVRLTNLGYHITAIASSKHAALTSAQQHRPDVVLMDIRLNGVPDGIAAARELRADFNLPVIYLTGHSDNATLAQARTTEPFGYILKPFENRELVAAIETAVYKHRAETRLREANTRLQLAQRAGRVGVFDWNAETGELYVTPELEELRQAPAGSIRDIDDLWGGPTDLAEQTALRARFADWIKSDRADESWEHRIPREPGPACWVQVRAHAYRDAAGQPVRIIGTEVDITGRKKMEDALLKKEKELERSNADLQAYAYTVAHDLQEPIRTLVSGVELIERSLTGKLESSQQRVLFFVKSSTERLQSMITGLLDYSRLSQEDESVSKADCNQVLTAAIASLHALIVDTGARIDSSQLPEVAVSEHRIVQLLQNLIGNALKFRRPGVAPCVKISAVREGAFWRFMVADNGMGFDMVYAERIFGVFKRLHARQVEGTGIGLSVCKRIVERAGGRIWAESMPGKGSTFLFTLPAGEKVES